MQRVVWRPPLRVVWLVVAALAAALAVAGCGSGSSTGGANASASGCKPPRMVLIINSNLGDGGFYDQANGGVTRTARQFGLCEKTIETGSDPTRWAPAVQDVSSGNADIVIAGSYEMAQLVEQAAQQHPEKKFVLFDVAYDPKACGGCKNIYSVTLRSKENGYLAGVLAGLLTRSRLARTNPQNVVGFIGGQNIPVILDYHDGFVAGVKQVNPTARIISVYAGSFTDPVKGKQLASGMIGQGADIVFTASGSTDKGVIEAAAEDNAWALGDSALQTKQSAVNGKQAVITAVDGDIGTPLTSAVRAIAENRLPVGSVGSFGVKEGAIKIIDSPNYEQFVPESVRKEAQAVQAKIANGQLVVP